MSKIKRIYFNVDHADIVTSEDDLVGEKICDDFRTCRRCGCSNYFACVDEETEDTCYWVEDDLCSFCEGKE